MGRHKETGCWQEFEVDRGFLADVGRMMYTSSMDSSLYILNTVGSFLVVRSIGLLLGL